MPAVSAEPFIVGPASSRTLRISRRPSSASTEESSTRPLFAFARITSTPAVSSLRAFAEFTGAVVNTRRFSSEVFTMRDFGDRRSPESRMMRSSLPRRRRLLRIILDSGLRLSPKSRIVKTSDENLLVFTTAPVNSAKARKLETAGVEVIRAKAKSGRVELSSVLAELGRREILSVLLEAGPTMNGSALTAGIVHKLFLFYAPKIAGGNRVPFALLPKLSLPPPRNIRTQQFGPDFAVESYLPDIYEK